MNRLLVIIPTKNEKNNLLKIVTALKKSLKGIDHQIVISNNSDRDLNINLSNLEIKQLKTPEIFITAEQHLFWVIEQVTGEYVWFFGDDDIPIEKGIKKLAQLVNQGRFDCFAFNGLRHDPKNEKIVKMINNSKTYQGKLKYFYSKSGMLNGPSSISLYVIKKEFLAKKYLTEIRKLNAPIYSHIILFLRSFNNAEFAYHPIDIVEHRQSDPKQNKEISLNWSQHAEESRNFYYFPWTLGFLRNINYLIKKGTIEKDFLLTIVETDPKNRKYELLPQIEDYIRRIFIPSKTGSRKITKSEVLELKKYVTEIQGFSEEIRNIVSSGNPINEILKLYPHMNPILRYLSHKLAILKYRIFILFQKAPKDVFWILITKLWPYTPRFVKQFLKKLKSVLRRLK
jgi:hypothetical protein